MAFLARPCLPVLPSCQNLGWNSLFPESWRAQWSCIKVEKYRLQVAGVNMFCSPPFPVRGWGCRERSETLGSSQEQLLRGTSSQRNSTFPSPETHKSSLLLAGAQDRWRPGREGVGGEVCCHGYLAALTSDHAHPHAWGSWDFVGRICHLQVCFHVSPI